MANAFAQMARRFCGLVEQAPVLGPFELLCRLNAILPDLYGAAVRLPDVAPASAEAPASVLGQERWSVTFNAVRKVLGPYDVYWVVFDPAEQEEPVAGSVADDLVDTYRDVLDGLALLDQGAPLADVIWTWRFSFQSHWGRHVLDALRATHWLIHGHRIGPGDS